MSKHVKKNFNDENQSTMTRFQEVHEKLLSTHRLAAHAHKNIKKRTCKHLHTN